MPCTLFCCHYYGAHTWREREETEMRTFITCSARKKVHLLNDDYYHDECCWCAGTRAGTVRLKMRHMPCLYYRTRRCASAITVMHKRHAAATMSRARARAKKKTIRASCERNDVVYAHIVIIRLFYAAVMPCHASAIRAWRYMRAINIQLKKNAKTARGDIETMPWERVELSHDTDTDVAAPCIVLASLERHIMPFVVLSPRVLFLPLFHHVQKYHVMPVLPLSNTCLPTNQPCLFPRVPMPIRVLPEPVWMRCPLLMPAHARQPCLCRRSFWRSLSNTMPRDRETIEE